MMIRQAKASDAEHLVRFINMAADDLPLHFWWKSVGAKGDPWACGRERAARETGNFSFRNEWLTEVDGEVDGEVAACLLGYPAGEAPGHERALWLYRFLMDAALCRRLHRDGRHQCVGQFVVVTTTGVVPASRGRQKFRRLP